MRRWRGKRGLGGPAGGGGSLPASGGAGLGLALAEALGQVALDPEAMALLGDQPAIQGVDSGTWEATDIEGVQQEVIGGAAPLLWLPQIARSKISMESGKRPWRRWVCCRWDASAAAAGDGHHKSWWARCSGRPLPPRWR